jgi:hypothetical protein
MPALLIETCAFVAMQSYRKCFVNAFVERLQGRLPFQKPHDQDVAALSNKSYKKFNCQKQT